MVRHLFIAGCLLLAARTVQAQVTPTFENTRISVDSFPTRGLSPYSISVRGGLTQFFGELNTQKMKFVGGASIIRNYTPAFSVGLDFTAGKLGGEKKEFFNSYFESSFSSIELLARWDLLEQFNKDVRTRRLSLTPYGGLGLMLFSSNAYDLTTNKLVRFTNSANSGRNPLFADYGAPQGKIGIRKTHERTIPLGLMLGYRLSETLMLGVDYRYYLVRTDKLDATSGRRLINPEEADSYSNTPNDKFSSLTVSVTHRFTNTLADTDNDGIPDRYDRCPTVPGPKALFGCPDRDGDGIPDYVDQCPDAPGTAKTRGCPDTDGDGVLDRYDECPTVAGTLKGCPDRDGDGVKDEFDGCPDTPGLPRFGGCPDTDGDGIPDQVDFCPTIPGTYTNGGCPDTDGDGVHDGIDQCPDQPGPKYNKGCPVVEPAKVNE